MKAASMFFETKKEMPKDAEMISHKLLIKGGYVSLSSSGVYAYLPLFLRVYEKVEKIIIEEMNRIGGQQLLLPVLTPKELWDETGRWNDFGSEMFRLKDRKNRDYALCPTHEEVITDIARKSIRSYKQLPQIWYQIQTKFRDEPRPRSGLLRVRQFEMKDSYSLDTDLSGLETAYNKHREAYIRIFKRCGIDLTIVEAASGLMGGAKSEEFMAISDSGEDRIALCNKCDYSSNMEVADTKSNDYNFEDSEITEIHTPIKGDVETVSNYLKEDKKRFIKSILIITNNEPIFLLVPGDRDIEEKKIELIFGGKFRYANDKEINKYTGADKGYISPINLDIKVYADTSLIDAKGMISGANKNDFHIKGINIKRDVKNIEFVNIKTIRENDDCPVCDNGKLAIKKCIEIGHIFQLGTKYSASMKAMYLDNNGKEKPIVMGSYGIGLGRVISTIIEQYHDENGIIWPINIAPFSIMIIPLNIKNEKIMNKAEELYALLKKDHEVVLDDRDLRAGNKFKDADLTGIPVRIIIGKKFVETNEIEISIRNSTEKITVKPTNVINVINKIITEQKEILKID